MKFHYSMGLVGIMAVIFITAWYAVKMLALSTGYFVLVYTLISLVINGSVVFLYIRTFAQYIFPELEGVIKIGAIFLYDSLLTKVEKHSQLPAASRKPFVYPDSLNNAHRGIIEYIPRYGHQRKVYIEHYRFIIEELRQPDCHYGLVLEQIEELKRLLDH